MVNDLQNHLGAAQEFGAHKRVWNASKASTENCTKCHGYLDMALNVFSLGCFQLNLVK